VGHRIAISEDSNLEHIERRKVDPTRLTGVAPRCKLISLKVLNDQGRIRSTDVLRALEYVRVSLNGHGKPPLRVHGVNISLGYEFNAKWFACGQSPVCIEVDRLVRTGVVVVCAAGNTGYGELTTRSGRTSTGLSLTINDPGNSNLALTVGATHKDSPHTYGVSYFSSKGPTGDGRAKPDLVAPGERIISCAAGRQLDELRNAISEMQTSNKCAGYIDLSGTSMAAPHVSGAIAAFLSIRREFIGRSEDVKRIFLDTATSLGRERYFEGHGLVDLMRAIQSI
jgi:subtilisin family serine protease